MAIVPDDKDWTWVLDRRCPECGFDASTFPPEEVTPLIRACALSWGRVLNRPPGELRTRPGADRWSPLEYACHIRDVFVLYDQRLELMLGSDDPTFPNWDQDRGAEESRYNEQDVATVRAELAAAADRLAHSFSGVSGTQWRRRGARSDGARFSVESFARYMIHDPVHHLYDVGAD